MMALGSNGSDAVLERLLLIVPMAAREGGVTLGALSERLGVPPARLLKDLEEVEGRSYYLHAGKGAQIQLFLSGDRIEIWTTGEFRRPVRLTPREALSLDLALRLSSRAALADDQPGINRVRERVVEALQSPVAADALAPAVVLGEAEGGIDTIRPDVELALRAQKTLELRYASPGRDPSVRMVAPLRLVHAEGQWYLIARDLKREGYRAFRLDRVLTVHVGEETFAPDPQDDEAAERFIQDGWVHDGGPGQATEATVEYSPLIARWIRERGWEGMEETSAGVIRVRHSVADLEWLIRHVLGYAGEAVVIDPPWLRDRVREAALQVASYSPGSLRKG
jgi:proteasome accessory factor C